MFEFPALLKKFTLQFFFGYSSICGPFGLKKVPAKYFSVKLKKMAVTVIELEKVVKALSRKVIHLKEEIISVKACSHKACLNEPFTDTLEFKNSTPVSEKKVLAVGDTKSKES